MRFTARELGYLGQDKPIADLSSDQHSALEKIFKDADLAGDHKQAPTVGHLAMVARSLQNSGSETNEKAAMELFDFITNMVAPDDN